MKINAINSVNYTNKNYGNNTPFTGLFSKKYSYDYDVYMPQKQSKFKNKFLEKINDMMTAEISNNSTKQSKYFMLNGIINYKTKIADGFMEVSSDGKVYDDGTCRSNRPVIVVDRDHDIVLSQLIEKAKDETIGFDENDKVRYLTQLLTKTTSKKPIINPKPNELVYAGDLLGSYASNGRQDSIMFKVISDEIGLKTDLVKGMAAGSKRMWNVVHYKNGVNKIHDVAYGIVEDARKSKVYIPMNKR